MKTKKQDDKKAILDWNYCVLKARSEANLSREDFSAIFDQTYSFISKVETGQLPISYTMKVILSNPELFKLFAQVAKTVKPMREKTNVAKK